MVIEAIKERDTLKTIARKYELHSNQITSWKKEFLENAEIAFQNGSDASDEKKQREEEKNISVTRQCGLLSIPHSGLYYQPSPESEENLLLMRLLDEQYFNTPFYGNRLSTNVCISMHLKMAFN